jgi:hypothetical protein
MHATSAPRRISHYDIPLRDEIPQVESVGSYELTMGVRHLIARLEPQSLSRVMTAKGAVARGGIARLKRREITTFRPNASADRFQFSETVGTSFDQVMEATRASSLQDSVARIAHERQNVYSPPY